MYNFENNLCNTVDAILELLGQTPKVVRAQYCDASKQFRGDSSAHAQGIARFEHTQSEAEIVLQSA